MQTKVMQTNVMQTNVMQVKVTFRHGTEDPLLRDRVSRDCHYLRRLHPDMAGVSVVFSREARLNRQESLYACHIKVKLPGRQDINVYEHRTEEATAFHRAMEQVINRLSKLTTRHAEARSATKHSGGLCDDYAHIATY